MEEPPLPEKQKELRLYRQLLAVAGSVYLIWWFAVEITLPQSQNPLLSRIEVGITFFLVLAFSYPSRWVQHYIKILFLSCIWLLTFHYYYLLYLNAGDINWVIGAYITVIAINFCLFSATSLLSYSLFVIALSAALLVLIPSLQQSVFFPGLVTILAQSNFGLRSRLGLIKTLEQSNERFQLLFNSTFEGVLVHEKGKILNVNESLAKMMGYSRKELMDRYAFDLIAPEDRDRAIENMKSSQVPAYETRGLKKDGTSLDIDIRAKDFNYDSRTVRLVTIQDVTDRKKVEKEKFTAQALAENVRIRDEFISLASHELKTPISSLQLQTQLMDRNLKKGNSYTYTPEKINVMFLLINRQVTRLAELVDTMLDVSRISSGRLEIEKTQVDLSALVREAAESFQIHDTQSNAPPPPPLRIDAPPQLIVLAEKSRILQVIENLLSNAIKYGKGSPIQINVTSDHHDAFISVEDRGLGISAENLSRIFNRFERALSHQNISGLGLGLYIAQKIAQAHGGEISVQSQLGIGSTFTLKLPLQ